MCPNSLREYDSKFSVIRNFINYSCRINPFYKHALASYSQRLACNKETQSYMKNSDIVIDVPLNGRFRNLEINTHVSKKPIILFCGRFINKKGVILLLDVIKRMNFELDFEVHLYGDGEQKDIVANKIKKLGLDSKIKLRGKLTYEEITLAYRSADIFVLPSLRESGGNVLIEAMAHKLPIVSLDMSLSNILYNKNTGVFVNINQSKDKIISEFAESLEYLVKNPDQRRYFGENGYKYVNTELIWENMIETVYGKFLKEKKYL